MNSAQPKTIEQQVLRPSEFRLIRDSVYKHCGVDLQGKEVLVSARLGKKLRELNLRSFEDYCSYIQKDASRKAFTEMIDALTTNHTSFFREIRHFEFLQQTVLPAFATQPRLNIWSAACSSGEEPYSIALAAIQTLGSEAFSKVSIAATDISTRVLDKARAGVYEMRSLQGLSPDLMRACLLRGTGPQEDRFMVKPEIRRMVEFRQLNLLDDCSSVGPFHVIFCRNVMIYFDRPTQQLVIDRLVSRLLPGGYLLIGHAESLNGIQHQLSYVRSAIFRKAGDFSQERPKRAF